MTLANSISLGRIEHAIDAYARDVVRGKVPAGKYHRLACERHLRDRRREDTRGFPYRFDWSAADRFLRFASKLKHYKGEWAGQPIVLEPHQVFRLGSIFGWRHVKTGLRRFRTAYNELPRKQGKSLEAAIVAVYTTFFDAEPGAEGYTIATKRDQAKIVFRDAKKLVESSGLRRRIHVLANSLVREAISARLMPLGADYDGTDGLNPNLIITDEFHAHKNRGLIDVIETATGARRQPLHFQITTAGSDPLSPCGDQHDYAKKILERILHDETFFAFIAHADEGDDPWSEKTWRKANPNYGVSVKPDDLRALAKKARNMPAAANAFKQKRLNIWVHAITPWLSMEGWRAGQTTWDPKELAGRECWGGLDLSSKTDLTAFALTFPPLEGSKIWRYLIWVLTPEETLADRALRDRAPYLHWVAEGVLRTNPGKRIDHQVLRDLVNAAGDVYDIQEIGFDPWNSANLPNQLDAEDAFVVTEVPMTVAQLSEPAKNFEAEVLEGLVDVGGNPLAQWSASNVVVIRDSKDNIFPTKKKSRGRIDPIVAAVIARKMAGQPPEQEERSAYDDGHPVLFV